MTQLNKRKCKTCSEVFQKKTPLDMFCSSECGYAYKRKKDSAKIKPNNLKRSPIKPISDRRKKQNTAYLLARKVYLMEEANKFCPVMKGMFNKLISTTEIHHMNGRENDRLNDRVYWLAVSREGHQWIHSNPQQARECGWLI